MGRLASLCLLVVSLLAVQTQAQFDVTLTCGRGFDAYLIIDHSTSVAGNFGTAVQKTAVTFYNLFKSQPRFRMAVQVFGSGTVEMLPIRYGDSQENIESTLQYMSNQTGKGATHGERGFEAIVSQMMSEPLENNKIVFYITDGVNSGPDPEMKYWSEEIQSARIGGVVFSIGVRGQGSDGKPEDIDVPVLAAIANGPEYVVEVSNFTALTQVFNKLQDAFSCTEISAILPGPVCAPWSAAVVTVRGKGFGTYYTGDDATTADQMACRYTIRGENSTTTHVVPVNKYNGDTELICNPPPEDLYTETIVEIRLREGQPFTQANLAITFYPSDDPACLPEAFPWWILLIIIPLILFLIWFFFPLLPKKTKFQPQDEEVVVPAEVTASLVAPLTPTTPPLPPPEMPPPKTKKRVKKWAKVDTTHYIWSRDGGTARPMECNWGATGAPESAPVKKGDMVYEVQHEPTPEIQEPQVEIIAPEPVAPAPAPQMVAPEGDFEDLEWDRCCCGMCASSVCDPCKSCMARTYGCMGMFCRNIGCKSGDANGDPNVEEDACCAPLCNLFTPCKRCYQWCDHQRPRPDCCGVGKNDDGTGGAAAGGGGGIATEMTATETPLPAGWEKLQSEDGAFYYYNEATDQSQWTAPT